MLDHLVGLVGHFVAVSPAVWFTFLDAAGRVVPVAIPFDELPVLPTVDAVAEVVEVVSAAVSQQRDGLEVLVAICRRSGGDVGVFERQWAGALWEAADAAGWRVRTVVAVGTDRVRELVRPQYA